MDLEPASTIARIAEELVPHRRTNMAHVFKSDHELMRGLETLTFRATADNEVTGTVVDSEIGWKLMPEVEEILDLAANRHFGFGTAPHELIKNSPCEWVLAW